MLGSFGGDGGEEGQGRGRHLCHMDEVGDDQGTLGGGGLAKDHELNPLGDAVEQGDEPLQHGVVHGAAMSHKTVIILELGEEVRWDGGLRVLPLPRATATPYKLPPHRSPKLVPNHPGSHQYLAERAILQVSEVFCQLQRLQVVKEQRHLALLLGRGVPLCHLPLPFVRGTGRGRTGVMSPSLHCYCLWRTQTHTDMSEGEELGQGRP